MVVVEDGATVHTALGDVQGNAREFEARGAWCHGNAADDMPQAAAGGQLRRKRFIVGMGRRRRSL
jgi:hypothetical protein